jgi:TRAP-type C4-dicarboxylate transport system substrate-binding protein
MLPHRFNRFRTVATATLFWLLACLAAPPATAQTPVRLRIVGGLASLNQYTRHEEPFWTSELPRLTQGRASAEIVPFDRAGIRGQEMLRLVQLGAVPFGTALLSASAALDPEVAAPDLAGLNPDIASMRRSTHAFRPYLEKMLRERYGIELLALYVYPAQELYCSKPIKGLSDVAGRRVRVSGPSQADWVEALGGIPVQTGFAEIVANLRSGNIECAITGTMSGNTIGLHEVTSHILSTPINWGLGAFIANKSAWAALPADLRDVLRRELPKLEAAIWAEAEQETGEGVACNIGAPSCLSGRKGRMIEVKDSPPDQALRRDILAKTVLPRWVQRCGPQCADIWRQTVGPSAGVAAPR